MKTPSGCALVVAVALSGACSSEQPSQGETFELHDSAATGPRVSVVIVTEPFELRVVGSDGKVVLSTQSSPAAGADDPDFVCRSGSAHREPWLPIAPSAAWRSASMRPRSKAVGRSFSA